MANQTLVPEKLKQARLARGLSQRALANKLGVGPSSIGMWETARRTPNVNMIGKMAEVFGVPIAYFYKEDTSNLREVNDQERQVLDAMRKNVRLGMLFERALIMSVEDVDTMLLIADRFKKED